MQSYSDKFDGAELTTGRELAMSAIRKSISRRRKQKGDWADPHLSEEHAGHEEVDGKMASVRRVWARQDEEEFLLYDVGGAEGIAKVKPLSDEHKDTLPSTTRFGKLV